MISSFSSLLFIYFVLAPRHLRQCNTVAWSPIEPNLIAAGLEKHRTDHSVLLWDLQRCPHTNGLLISSSGIVFFST